MADREDTPMGQNASQATTSSKRVHLPGQRTWTTADYMGQTVRLRDWLGNSMEQYTVLQPLEPGASLGRRISHNKYFAILLQALVHPSLAARINLDALQSATFQVSDDKDVPETLIHGGKPDPEVNIEASRAAKLAFVDFLENHAEYLGVKDMENLISYMQIHLGWVDDWYFHFRRLSGFDEDRELDCVVEVSVQHIFTIHDRQLFKMFSNVHLEIKPHPTLNKGVFARVPLLPETTIFEEHPLARAGHSLRSKRDAYDALKPPQKIQFMSLESRCCCVNFNVCDETPVGRTWHINGFGDESESYLYYLGSNFNHACLPNAVWDIGGEGELIVKVLKEIKKGEEITIAYFETDGSAVKRRKITRDLWKFDCACDTCTMGVDISIKIYNEWFGHVEESQ